MGPLIFFSSVSSVLFNKLFVRSSQLAFAFLLVPLLSHTHEPPDLSYYFHLDTGKPSIQLTDITQYLGVTRYDFIFKSINWPKNTTWHHRLSIYVPEKMLHQEGLMLVNGGINQPIDTEEKDPYDNKYLFLFYAYLARQTHSIIVELKDIPNQYLRLDDGVDRKEDDLLAHNWRQFMEHPNSPTYPLLFPMAKATSIALDAVVSAAEKIGFEAPTHYVLTGISKRGWSSWLTLLEDKRIVALVTAVNEILDVENTAKFIKKSIQYWPDAFKDYVNAQIPEYLGSSPFKKLMSMTDPYGYINHPRYQQRFTLPKYLIRTSGDDFYTPDCQNQLFKTMPGENYVRVLPNQGHRLSGTQYLFALKDFYSTFIRQKAIPKISESFFNDQLSHVAFDQPAKKITLWRAHNPSRPGQSHYDINKIGDNQTKCLFFNLNPLII